MTPTNTSVLLATVWAVLGAVGGREFGIPGAAAVCTLALAVGSVVRSRTWLCAWPAALSAAAPTAAPVPLPVGPIEFRGEVLPGVETDPARGQTRFELRTRDGARTLCIVAGRFPALPGDVVAGVGRIPRTLRDDAAPLILALPEGLRRLAGKPSIWRLAEAARRDMAQRLRRCVPGASGDLLCHLVLGRGPWLPEELVRAHRATGLTHLLAVSGAHATMLAFMLGLLFRALTGRSPLRAAFYRRGAMVLLLFYGFLTSMEPPVFRALVATFVFFWCHGADRHPPIGAALAVPALLTAVLVPEDLFSVSFNLSYAAVFGLTISGVFRTGPRTFVQRYLLTPAAASVWATLTTMPVTLWTFGQCAPWTILATPLLSPLVALMLATGLLLGTVGAALPFLEPLFAIPAWLLTECYCAIVQAFAMLPGAPIHATVRAEPFLLVACALPGIAACIGLRTRSGVAILSLGLSLPHFLGLASITPPGLRLLAVGHGQACLLQTRSGARVLVDCGSLGQPRRAAFLVRKALLPARRLDLLIVTHGDADHTAGLMDLLQHVPIAAAALSRNMRGGPVHELLVAHGCGIRFVAAGTTLRPLPGLTVWAPDVGHDASSNDRSLWIRADLGSFRALLPGDALERGTERFLRSTMPKHAEVLVLPHHGREHGTIEPLLQAVRPRLALASSAGRDGVSDQARIARRRGIPVLHTGLVGTITVQDRGQDAQVETERPLRIR